MTKSSDRFRFNFVFTHSKKKKHIKCYTNQNSLTIQNEDNYDTCVYHITELLLIKKQNTYIFIQKQNKK